MRTRIRGMTVALAVAGILCLGSNLPAGPGRGGSGGGNSGGSSRSGGMSSGSRSSGGMSGGSRSSGGMSSSPRSSGGMSSGSRSGGGMSSSPRSSGGMSSGSRSSGGMSSSPRSGGAITSSPRTSGTSPRSSAPQQPRTSIPQQPRSSGSAQQFAAPQQPRSTPRTDNSSPFQNRGSSVQNFGSAGQQGRGNNALGGSSRAGSQPQQPSFSSRYGSRTSGNLATRDRTDIGKQGTASNGLNGSGASRHLSAPTTGSSDGLGSRSNSFTSRHSAGNTGSGTANLAARTNGGREIRDTNGGISGRQPTQASGLQSRRPTGSSGVSSNNSGSNGNFASRYSGRSSGAAGAGDRNDRTGSSLSRHSQSNSIARTGGVRQANNNIPTGAIGSNRGGNLGRTVNANQVWNNVGRNVGRGLSSFHNYNRGGNGRNFAGVNRGFGGYGRNGFYGNNFRSNRLFYGVGTGFWPYYAWNYRPIWGGGYGGWGAGSGWGFNYVSRGFGIGIGNAWGNGFGGLGWGNGWGNLGWGGNGFGVWGVGRPGFGYGGYGLGGFGYNSYCAYNPGYSMYSNGYTYVADSTDYYGYGDAPVTTAYAVDNDAPPSDAVQVAQIDADPEPIIQAQSLDADLDFAAAGEEEFKAGNYDKSVKMWRHAVLDDPKNGVLVMMLGQGLFAAGKFDEAAGATQQGMLLLKEEDWGVVVTNYRELYSKIGDYTTQLRVLEKTRKDKPEDPALRFLLGFHYSYLGFPTEAAQELKKATALAPKDELANRLKQVVEAKLKKTTDTTTTVVPPEPQGIPKKSD